jgi:hypothetical protein
MKTLKKAFLNEKGEISWTKTGTLIVAVGGLLATGIIPGAVTVGAALIAFGGTIGGMGLSNKIDRQVKK